MASLEDQLIDLQMRVAYQDETLSQLNDVVTSQQAQLDRLRVTVDDLVRLVGDATGPAASRDGAAETPPHY